MLTLALHILLLNLTLALSQMFFTMVCLLLASCALPDMVSRPRDESTIRDLREELLQMGTSDTKPELVVDSDDEEETAAVGQVGLKDNRHKHRRGSMEEEPEDIELLTGCRAQADALRKAAKKEPKGGRDGMFRRAMELYDEALLDDPADPLSLYGKGVAQRKLGLHKEAAGSFDLALGIDPLGEAAGTVGASWYNKGLALVALEKHPEALSAFSESCLLNPGPGPHPDLTLINSHPNSSAIPSHAPSEPRNGPISDHTVIVVQS